MCIPSVCHAVTVAEYNAAPNEVQNQAIVTIAKLTYKSLAESGASSEKLECVREFYARQEVTKGGHTYSTVPGFEAILDQIDIANQNGSTDLRIEDLLLGTINAHCGDR